MSKADEIMHLADVMADAKAAHSAAVAMFASDQIDYDEIPPLAAAYVEAQKALMTAVQKAVA